MARLRMYEPNQIYEVVARTIQGRFLLKPSPLVRRLMAGIIGRAQAYCPAIDIYNLAFLCNHGHMLISSEDPAQIPRFLSMVNGQISREIGLVHDWPGKLWEGRCEPTPILDDDALVARFRYILAHGAKEHLVASPRKWPGVHGARALAHGEPLIGDWIDRDGLTKARRKKGAGKISARDFTTRYEVELTPLPCWAHLEEKARQALVQEMLADIEAEVQQEARRTGKRCLGVKAILALDPHFRPDSVKKTPAPLCHTTKPSLRREYREKLRRFIEAFRRAARALLEGVKGVAFPLYCFPPGQPFVSRLAPDG